MSRLSDFLFYEEPGITLYCGDAMMILRELPPASVHCCVTSPPYWGLRDYGTATWAGGEADCDHAESTPSRRAASVASSGLDGSRETIHASHQFKGDCRRCGARRIDVQLGLEPTPELYVSHLVMIFREVRRVLRDDGTLWLNLGDSYATGAGSVGMRPGGGAQGDAWNGHRGSRGGSAKQPHTGSAIGPMTQPNRMPIAGLKPKDLVGVPWRVAFALQADGWWLRLQADYETEIALEGLEEKRK